MSEVPIESDQCSIFREADIENPIVSRTAELLLVDGRDVMPALAEEGYPAPADVLIDFNLHSAGSTGTGMMRSRAASAP